MNLLTFVISIINLKSQMKTEPYVDYYIWALSKGTDSYGNRILPNNWVHWTFFLFLYL